jgi:hypothetical protein
MKSPQAPERQSDQVPAHPRLPNRTLLIISSVTLVVWVIALALFALLAI